MALTNPPPFLALLSCDHTMIYSPLPRQGDVVWCDRCADYRQAERLVKAWRWVCYTCARGQSGMNDAVIRRASLRHQRRHPEHDVQVKPGDRVLEEIKPERQESLHICYPTAGSMP